MNTSHYARKVEYDNPLQLYVASMRKVFRVEHIARDDEEANEFCRKNPDYGVIAQTNNGLILCARIFGSIAPSEILADLRK